MGLWVPGVLCRTFGQTEVWSSAAAAVAAAAAAAGTTFEGADLTESVWEDALIGNEDVKRLCANPTLKGESRFQVGCRGK
jgi:hypothetical protein